MSNQAWQITSPDQLSLVDLGPIPTPGPGQVLLRIHAVSVNYRDLLVVSHNPAYPVAAKPNLIPGGDGAGIVDSLGSAVKKWKRGDRVFVQPNTWRTGTDNRDFDMLDVLGGGDIDGTFRRFMVIDEERLIRAPEELSFEEASTIYTAGVTAWQALCHGHIKLEPGMKVLTMGTGGLSCFAIQIAVAHGAIVVATSSSKEKLEVARQLGAKHLINYREHPDWAAEVLKVTKGEGVDIVVDVVGADSIEQSLDSLRRGGSVELVGMLSKDPNRKVDIMTRILYEGGKTINGSLGAGSRMMSEELSAFMEKHKIHPQIAQVFDFDQAKEALKAAEELTAPGKIVIKV